MIRRIAIFVTWAVVLGGLSVARAETKLSADIGWAGRIRAHRWLPVYVTASDSKNRNVMLEVYWPHGGNFAMRVHQAFAIGPQPTTFVLLMPVRGYSYAYQEATFTLTDRDTGKTLAHYPPQPMSFTPSTPFLDPAGALVGVSGRQSVLDSLQGSTPDRLLGIAYLEPDRLPSAAIGYDCLDLLVLNQPNLNTFTGGGDRAIDATQQQAILDWVRAGGNLMLWPGENGLPSKSPLADALPCRAGDRINLDLSEAEWRDAGVVGRPRITAFTLTPEADAERIALFGGKLNAYSKRLGLGRIVVAPLNIAMLQFQPDRGQDFWRPLLNGIKVLPSADVVEKTNSPSFGWGLTSDDQAETQAALRVADALGDVPGAGKFGFIYVVGVLMAMMVVVGPVDWFVLKRLGRQPWTWVTTTGWIVLITLAAVSVGFFLKSGDLHYRTMRVVYQVADSTIATNDTLGIYSPRTRWYTLGAEPDGWWQPAGIPDYSRTDITVDIDFHQTDQGNLPEPMRINVWSLRFLHNDHVGTGPPAIVASLNEQADTGRVTGIIKNLTDRPLKNIRIRTHHGVGVCKLLEEVPATAPATQSSAGENRNAVTEIPPYATVRVEADLTPEAAPAQPQNPRLYGYGYPQVTTPTADEMWKVAGQIDIRRSAKMDALGSDSQGEFACVYAEMVNPPPAVPLQDQKPIEKHWQFIRALVELHR